jgi:hypothetical protein
MIPQDTPRRIVRKPELIGTILESAHRLSAGRPVLDIVVEGEGESWGVTQISVTRPDDLPAASWTLAVVEARLRDLYWLVADDALR